MDAIWQRLFEAARAVQNERKISDYIDAGGVAAAVLSASGKIYTGVCIDTCSTLGICAERNAIFSMILLRQLTIEFFACPFTEMPRQKNLTYIQYACVFLPCLSAKVRRENLQELIGGAITAGENELSKVLAIMPNGKTGAPCGACRELMAQLMPNSYKNVEIMLDYESGKAVTLGELTPEWWI